MSNDAAIPFETLIIKALQEASHRMTSCSREVPISVNPLPHLYVTTSPTLPMMAGSNIVRGPCLLQEGKGRFFEGIPLGGHSWVYIGLYRDLTAVVGHQMEEKAENQMQTGLSELVVSYIV